MPEVLEHIVGPSLPPYTEHAWHAFLSLCTTRTIGAHGANAISYEELQAYQIVTGDVLTDLEIACVLAADRTVMQLQHNRVHTAAVEAKTESPE